VKTPANVLISFIPMYLIAVAYQELNKAEPDCGTTFTRASRAFGPIVGWIILMTYICYRGIEAACGDLLADAVAELVLAGRTGFHHHHRPRRPDHDLHAAGDLRPW
jgi:hypothetical protein